MPKEEKKRKNDIASGYLQLLQISKKSGFFSQRGCFFWGERERKYWGRKAVLLVTCFYHFTSFILFLSESSESFEIKKNGNYFAYQATLWAIISCPESVVLILYNSVKIMSKIFVANK